MAGLYYEGFTEGETITHDRRRTVSESDNQRFCDLTMNQQPLHLDADFAAETTFGERVVNGLYTMSLAVGLTVPDTIRAETTVLDKRPTSDGDRGIVTMQVDAYTTEGTLVCTFERTALVERADP